MKTTGYEYYNVTSDSGALASVRVYSSRQHTPYERHLTVSKSTVNRLRRMAPGDEWYCAPPTPYRPRAIFEVPQ